MVNLNNSFAIQLNTPVSVEILTIIIIATSKKITLKSIKLTKSALNPENPDSVDTDSVEMLEDLIMAATNEALHQADEASANMMSGLTGGLGGLGGLPF